MTAIEVTQERPVDQRDSLASGAKRETLALGIVLFAGLVVRLALLWQFQGVPLAISDERDYDILAASLVERGEYGFAPGQLTSIRPPVYPIVIAGIYQVAGVHNYQAVRAFQIVLSLVTVVVVYALGRRLYDGRVGLIAASIACFYPSLLGAGNLVLTETLFTLLVCAFLLITAEYFATYNLRWLALAGVVLGLGALTRSVLWLFPPFVVLMLLLCGRGLSWKSRSLACVVFVMAFAVTLTPWTVRNTRLQKTFTTVDVMGGRNVMMGNYEFTPRFRPWAAVEIQGEESWHRVLSKSHGGLPGKTQGEIDKLAMKYAISYVLSHPGQTLQRSTAKLFHFWQLERELLAGMHRGIWGEVSKATLIVTALIILGSYVAVMTSGIFGAWLAAPKEAAMHLLMLLLIGFVTLIHSIAFGHSRYHLPLMPIVILFAAAAWSKRRQIISNWRTPAFSAASVMVAVLAASWATDLVFESNRL